MDYWNIITHNAKRGTSASKFSHCYAGDLLRVSVAYSFSFAMSPEIEKVWAMFGCTFAPRI